MSGALRQATRTIDGYLRSALSPHATARQMEVLAAFVATGRSVVGAAARVGIRPITAKRHLATCERGRASPQSS